MRQLIAISCLIPLMASGFSFQNDLFWREGKGLINVYGAHGEKISSVAGLDIPLPKALAVDPEGNLVVFG
jgi:hypothetical protein